MAVTYPLSFPATPQPAQVEWGGMQVPGVSAALFTFVQQSYEWPGQRWLCSVRYAAMKDDKARPIIAVLMALEGRFGTCLWGPSGDDTTPRGVATGTPLVNGANQTGKTLVTDGWTPSVTGILKAGDFLQFGSGLKQRLHMNLVDVNSDAGGNATLDLWPRQRESPADNAAIVTASPKGVFRLRSNERKWDMGVASVYGVTFDLEEAF